MPVVQRLAPAVARLGQPAAAPSPPGCLPRPLQAALHSNETTDSRPSVRVPAALPADAQHDLGREELDHHLPAAARHHLALPQRLRRPGAPRVTNDERPGVGNGRGGEGLTTDGGRWSVENIAVMKEKLGRPAARHRGHGSHGSHGVAAVIRRLGAMAGHFVLCVGLRTLPWALPWYGTSRPLRTHGGRQPGSTDKVAFVLIDIRVKMCEFDL